MQNVANAYAAVAQTGLSGRELEASVLIKAAARLQAVMDGWDERQKELDEALTYNRRVWTVLASAVTDPSNPLPDPVKRDLAGLAAFIFKRTVDVLVEPRPDKLTSLISINRNIAAGLREQAKAA